MEAVFGSYSTAVYLIILICFLMAVYVAFKFKLNGLIFLNVALLSIALIEPSPSDLLFIPVLLMLFKFKGIKKLYKHGTVIFLLSIFITVNMLNLLCMDDYRKGIKFFAITIYLIIYGLTIFIGSSRKNYLLILRAYIIGSTVSALLGMLGYLGFFQNYLMYDSLRARALFKDPNVFGPFLVPSVILLISDIKSRKIVPGHVFFTILLICINTAGTVISFSRGAWAILGFGILLYFVLNIKKIDYAKLALYSTAVLAAAAILWFGVLGSGLKTFILERVRLQEYDSERFFVQKIGEILIDDNPLGYGPGQYEATVDSIIGKDLSAHSMYVRVLLENGFIGFAALMIFLAYIIVRLYLCHKKEKNDTLLKCSALISILSGVLINGFVVDTLHWRHLWLFIGLSMAVISESSDPEGDNNESQSLI
jgi:Lipid A core - O-antigen ligase and related enzymes